MIKAYYLKSIILGKVKSEEISRGERMSNSTKLFNWLIFKS